MSLVIEIPLDLEERLLQAAHGVGWDAADLAIHLLDECLPPPVEEDGTLLLFPDCDISTADRSTTDTRLE